MLLVDTEQKSLIQDIELKTHIAKSRPHTEWLSQQVRHGYDFAITLSRLDFQLIRLVRHVCPDCASLFMSRLAKLTSRTSPCIFHEPS